METNFTHSDMAALGNAAGAAGQRPSPPKKSGQMELGQSLKENRVPEEERQPQPGYLAAGPAPPASEPVNIQQPQISQDNEQVERQNSAE